MLAATPELKASYLVGGCVRDALLGIDSKDFDIEDFGVSYGPKILGEDVTVNISIEAGYKTTPPAPAAAPAKQG